MDNYEQEMCEYLEDVIRHHPSWNLKRIDKRVDHMFIVLAFENDTEVQINWHKKHFH